MRTLNRAVLNFLYIFFKMQFSYFFPTVAFLVRSHISIILVFSLFLNLKKKISIYYILKKSKENTWHKENENACVTGVNRLALLQTA